MGNQLTADQMVDVYRHAWTEQEKPDLKFHNGDNPESLLGEGSRHAHRLQRSL